MDKQKKCKNCGMWEEEHYSPWKIAGACPKGFKEDSEFVQNASLEVEDGN